MAACLYLQISYCWLRELMSDCIMKKCPIYFWDTVIMDSLVYRKL